MKNIQKIHEEAMELAEKADAALLKKNLTLFRELTVQALKLESEAAYELITVTTAEPTRSILFRSAAHLAKSIGYYAEALKLIELALSGNPFPEIRGELMKLKKEVEKGIRINYSPDEAIEHSYAELTETKKKTKIALNESPQGKPKKNNSGESKTTTEIDHNKFKDIFTTHYQPLLIHAYTLIKNMDAATEIVEEVFVEFIHKPPKSLAEINVRGYLFKLTKSEYLRYLVRKNINEIIEKTGTRESLQIEDIQKEIATALNSLQETDQSTFRLFFIQDKTPQEVATILNKPETSIRMRISRLKKILREFLLASAVENKNKSTDL